MWSTRSRRFPSGVCWWIHHATRRLRRFVACSVFKVMMNLGVYLPNSLPTQHLFGTEARTKVLCFFDWKFGNDQLGMRVHRGKETDVLMKIQGHPNICSCLGCYDAYRPGTSQAQYIMMLGEWISVEEPLGNVDVTLGSKSESILFYTPFYIMWYYYDYIYFILDCTRFDCSILYQ